MGYLPSLWVVLRFQSAYGSPGEAVKMQLEVVVRTEETTGGAKRNPSLVRKSVVIPE